MPWYALRTARPRRVRVQRTYSAWGPGASCPQVRTVRRGRYAALRLGCGACQHGLEQGLGDTREALMMAEDLYDYSYYHSWKVGDVDDSYHTAWMTVVDRCCYPYQEVDHLAGFEK